MFIVCLAVILITQTLSYPGADPLKISSEIMANGGLLYHTIQPHSSVDVKAFTKAEIKRLLIKIAKYDRYLANIKSTLQSFSRVRG